VNNGQRKNVLCFLLVASIIAAPFKSSANWSDAATQFPTISVHAFSSTFLSFGKGLKAVNDAAKNTFFDPAINLGNSLSIVPETTVQQSASVAMVFIDFLNQFFGPKK
jgi:hypothetical protein